MLISLVRLLSALASSGTGLSRRALPILELQIGLLCWMVTIGVVAGQVTGSELSAAEPRYLAVWVDGTLTAADEILAWGGGDAQPSIAGRSLFDSGNPVRTLVDTTLARPAPPDRYVEFHGGDRLRGRIVRFVDAEDEPGVPAHVVVELDGDLGLANVLVRARVRVLPEWIRRVVHRPPAGAGVPAKGIRCAGGGSASFEELRWRSDGVQVLTDAGVKSCAYADITLLDSGAWQPWEAWRSP
jgi:hypothetical protein